MNEIFISYSRQDKTFVQKLKTSLNQAGIDPWIDTEDIWPATEWQDEILIAIQSCHDFIFIVSPHSCTSKYCQWELLEALKHNKRIIPLANRDIQTSIVLPSLRGIQWINFKDFNDGFEKLLWVLNAPHGISHQRLDAKIELQRYQEFRSFYLYRNSYLIGRFPQTSIEINGIIFVKDPTVSRTHLTLVLEDRWQVMAGFFQEGIYTFPKNGAYLNKKMMQPRRRYTLRHGDCIDISGTSSMKYLEMNPPEPEEAGDDQPTLSSEDVG